jgi:hypothetical protein
MSVPAGFDDQFPPATAVFRPLMAVFPATAFHRDLRGISGGNGSTSFPEFSSSGNPHGPTLRQELAQLNRVEEVDAEKVSDKFSPGTDCFKFHYGGMKEFHEGLEGKIGAWLFLFTVRLLLTQTLSLNPQGTLIRAFKILSNGNT